jgi:pimeloyl-ACP methyl ester carboxylesterase
MTKKTPLLLIPGLASSRIIWQRQIEGLQDIADCWVAPLPAHEDLGKIAEVILTESPNRFALAGWSMGGYLCFEILKRAPERVIQLGLFCTTADPETPEVAARREASIERAKKNGFLAMMRDLVLRFIPPERHTDHELIETVAKQAFEAGFEAYCKHQRAMIKRPDYRPLLARIECPTTILAGRQDMVTRIEHHASMAQSISESHMAIIENAGHLITLEQPENTTELMRQWLLQSSRARAA